MRSRRTATIGAGVLLVLAGASAGCRSFDAPHASQSDRCDREVRTVGWQDDRGDADASVAACCPNRGGCGDGCRRDDDRSDGGALAPCCGFSNHFDECRVRFSARRAAHRALDRIEEHCGDEPSGDFQSGFHQAYVDVALGLSGAPPALPPSSYWTASYRTPAGRRDVRAWFDGYESGAASAFAEGLPESRPVESSGRPCGDVRSTRDIAATR